MSTGKADRSMRVADLSPCVSSGPARKDPHRTETPSPIEKLLPPSFRNSCAGLPPTTVFAAMAYHYAARRHGRFIADPNAVGDDGARGDEEIVPEFDRPDDRSPGRGSIAAPRWRMIVEVGVEHHHVFSEQAGFADPHFLAGAESIVADPWAGRKTARD